MSGSPDLSEFDAHEEVAELRSLVRTLETKLKKAKAKEEDLVEAVHKGAHDAALVLGKPEPVKAPKLDKRKNQEEVALLHLSDWQLGKKTASYSTEVALDRIKRLGDKVLQMTEIERSDHPVRKIAVLLGGDMVEGDLIFPNQAWEIDSTLFDQTFAAAGAIRDLLRVFLANFDEVHVWQEEGNHGRMGRKNDHPREDNIDLMVYRMVKERFEEEGESRLFWNGRHSFYQIVEIGNYRALLVHGDEVKGFGGNIPQYGILKRVNSWASGVIEQFDDCYMGHWHQRIVVPLANGKNCVFVNPSLESDSIYAQEFMASSGTPGQRLNFVDPDAGQVTTERILWMNED